MRYQPIADGPNTGGLPADEVFALWARIEADWQLEEQYDFPGLRL